MIHYGLAPYHKDKLIRQLNGSICCSISFHEVLNSIVQKFQMDVSSCSWDDKEQMFKARYLDSQFLERPDADNWIANFEYWKLCSACCSWCFSKRIGQNGMGFAADIEINVLSF